MVYKENNVFQEANERIEMLFDTHDDIIVNMSGGKDSTVVFNIALEIARKKNRLPLKVFWLDQEAEWQHTVDYVDSIMRMQEVKPFWFQIPFDFTNSLSSKTNFVRVWDEAQKDKWIHEQSDISIKENPTDKNRFHDLMEHLHEHITDGENCAVLSGMRISESNRRRMAICFGKAKFRGETWCQKKRKKTQVFWPIYDFSDSDIWTAIAKNHWDYNPVYDLMYRWNAPKSRMRVSALIHETSWFHINQLQEFEPKTYNRFIDRVNGTSALAHAFDTNSEVPTSLPFMFKDWKEYRDYLLVHITKPEYWDLFRKRWKKQTGEDWYKLHVKELVINDIDGTINGNHAVAQDLKHKKDTRYKDKMEGDLKRYMQEKGEAK